MSYNDPGPLPNRWLHCPRKSETVIAEKFLAFKTPLSKAFTPKMPIECMFTPEMIFDYCKTLKLKLGLWIDLTNSKRFYDREIVESRGTQYVKLQCRGHGETPSPEQTHAFIEIVDNFINERPFDTIAVHCTHGFNRTGFLIASYMVERLDCSLEAALSIFAKARPPGIYKQDYINELFRRYENGDAAVEAPALPTWHLEYDDSARGEDNHLDKRSYDDSKDDDEAPESGGGVGGNGSRKKRRRELVVENAKFMDGVSGVYLVSDQTKVNEIQDVVQDMCKWEKSGFPGCQPVSMDQNNLKRLHEKPYRVSWKADGTRYMMVIKKRNEVYFVDRNNSVFQVQNITFVKSANLDEHLENTLLDGEMVLDKLGDETTPRFLIYDIIKLGDVDIGKEPFYPNRLECIKTQIIDPRYEAMAQGKINRSHEPFSVRKKDFWDIRTSASLLGEKFAKTLLHEPDGLVFQPSNDPYVTGVSADVLKWKPSTMNSVDFRLKIVTENGVGILPRKIALLYVGGSEHPYSKMKYTSALKELDNKIIECFINGQGQWELMRERKDKTLPNSFTTAESVVHSIRYPVTKEYLLHYIKNYGFRDENNSMPPPMQTSHGARPHQANHAAAHQR